MESNKGYAKIKPKEGHGSFLNILNFMEGSETFSANPSSWKSLSSVIISVVVYLVLATVLSAVSRNIFIGLLIWLIGLFLLFRGISIFVFNEKSVKEDYDLRKNNNDELNISTFWDIYDYRESYPYVLYYLDGTIGLAFQLIRKSTIGDVRRDSYLHFEAISSMLRIAKMNNLTVSIIDVQSSETRDVRLDEVYENLDGITNPVLEKVMSAVYSYWDDIAVTTRLSTETVIFKSNQNEQVLWENVQIVLAELMQGNYKGYKNLTADDLGTVMCHTFGLETFAVKEATRTASDSSGQSSLRFLWAMNSEGKKLYYNGYEESGDDVDEGVSEDIPEVEVENNELIDVFNEGTILQETVDEVPNTNWMED